MRPLSIRMMTIATAATGATSLQQTRFVYKLGNSIYVPLTSRCNSLTLPQLRGEGFTLPTSVVAALSRVRDAEQAMTTNKGAWYDSIGGDAPLKMKLPEPSFERIAALPPLRSESEEREPRLGDLSREIELEFREADGQQIIESIVISGEGEPTLRLQDTINLVQRIKAFTTTLPLDQPMPSIRLTTNGLVESSNSIPQLLWDSGVSSISVGLMTWNERQYNKLVKPLQGEQGFEIMCNFIKDAVSVDGDLEIETTAVDRPDVDKERTEALAASLGVTKAVRWRPYFPSH